MAVTPPPQPARAAGARPAGIPDSPFAGPFPVGEYAAALRTRLRAFARVQLIGELVNLRPSRARLFTQTKNTQIKNNISANTENIGEKHSYQTNKEKESCSNYKRKGK